MGDALLAVTVARALLCGLRVGVFFAFSSFVMPPSSASARPRAWRRCRRSTSPAVTPPFMTVLFAPAVACLGLAVAALADLGEPHAPCLLAGSLSYVAGTAGLTIA